MEDNTNANSPEVRLFIEKREYSIVPGSVTEIAIRVRNQGETQEYFELGIRGVPANWGTLSTQVLLLGPGEEQEVTLKIQPPPPPQSQAGISALKVVAFPQGNPQNITEIELTLRLAVFESQGRIGVMMDSVQFSVSPGSMATVPVLLLNQGLEADSFRLRVTGIPVNWISTRTPKVRLEPGEKKEVEFSIQPPHSPSSKAGRHRFTLFVESELVPDEMVEVGCILTVSAYSSFKGRLEPDPLRAGDTAQVSVENLGNVDESFEIAWNSQQGQLEFEALLPAPEGASTGAAPAPQVQIVPLVEPYTLRVQGGEVGSVDFRARPARKPLFGGEVQYPYTISIQPVGKPEQERAALQGTVVSSASIPVWVLTLLVIVCLAAACVSVVLFTRTQNQGANATEQALAGTATSLALTPDIAATQTAAAVAGNQDTDGDGLSDTQEVEIGTDPTNPDTDADALSDGDEVLQRTTDPLNPDTDGDVLTDGDEVRRSTDPLNPDTDRDGLMDGNEVEIGTDPLNPDTDNDRLQDGQESPPCPDPLDPDSDDDAIIDGQDLDPCDANNPSLTATAAAGQPTPEATLEPTVEPPPEATVEASVTPPPEETTAPPSFSGVIAFESNRDGNPEIYAQDGADQSVTRLTNSSGSDTQPAWSPGGDQLAFTSNRDGNNEIYLMNADGSGLINLTNDPADDQNPAWSPDGGWLTYSTNRDGNTEVYIVRVDGSDLANLTNNPAADSDPTWFSTQGLLGASASIAFVSDRDGNNEIYLMNIDGSDQVNLTNNPANDSYPAGSPGGGRIAFASDRDGQQEIYLMFADGSSLVNITNNPAEDLFPGWAPDGEQIAFTSNREGNREIYIMRTDGTEVINITNNAAEDLYPSWR